jgi:hypothetical protein
MALLQALASHHDEERPVCESRPATWLKKPNEDPRD